MDAEKKKALGERVKKAIGVKGDFKTVVMPMIAYSIVNMSTSGGSYVFSLYYLAFLTKVEGLSAGQVGTIMMIKTLWDAVTDPMMGIITDRTRSKLGKHRPYIYAMIIPFALVTVMTWSSFGISSIGNASFTMIYYIIAFMLYSTVTTVLTVPHTAMLPQLAPEYFERTQYNSVGYLMNSAGMVPSFLIASCFLGFFKTKPFEPGLRLSFTVFGAVLAIIYAIPIWYCATHTREKSSKDMHVEKFNAKYFFSEYATVFKNKTFRQYFFITLLMTLSNGFYNNSKFYFIDSVAGSASWYNLLIMITGVAEASVFPLNYAITKKYGKTKCAWVLMPLYFTALVIDLFIFQQVTDKFTLVTLLLFAEGIFFIIGYAGLGFTTSNSFPDTTDVDEMITGKRREGVLSTFSSFLKKLSSGFMTGIVGFILEWFGVSVDSADGGVISSGKHAYEIFGDRFDAVFGLRLAHAVVPIVMMIIAFAALRNYRLDQNSHKLLRAAIATKHKFGSVTLTAEEIATCERVSGQKWENTWLGKDNNETVELERNEDGEFVILLEIEEEARQRQKETEKRLEEGVRS